MDVQTVIYYLISLLLIVDGVYALIKGTQLFSRAKEKEQRAKYPTTYEPAHRFFGACILIAGICFIVDGLLKKLTKFDSPFLLLGGIAVVIIGLVVYYIILKKKPKGTSKSKRNDISGYGE